LLINNDLDGVGDVVTGTVFGLVPKAPITAAPRPGVHGPRLIAAYAARIAAGLLPELKTSATLTLNM
jgi:hypothetical protein